MGWWCCRRAVCNRMCVLQCMQSSLCVCRNAMHCSMLVLCVVSCSCVCLAGGGSISSSVFTGTYASSSGSGVSSLPPLSAMRNGHEVLADVDVCGSEWWEAACCAPQWACARHSRVGAEWAVLTGHARFVCSTLSSEYEGLGLQT